MKKPFRVYLSNISNIEELRKTFSWSRNKLKGYKIKFDREIDKTYYEGEDNVTRRVQKSDLGYNLVLF